MFDLSFFCSVQEYVRGADDAELELQIRNGKDVDSINFLLAYLTSILNSQPGFYEKYYRLIRLILYSDIDIDMNLKILNPSLYFKLLQMGLLNFTSGGKKTYKIMNKLMIMKKNANSDLKKILYSLGYTSDQGMFRSLYTTLKEDVSCVNCMLCDNNKAFSLDSAIFTPFLSDATHVSPVLLGAYCGNRDFVLRSVDGLLPDEKAIARYILDDEHIDATDSQLETNQEIQLFSLALASNASDLDVYENPYKAIMYGILNLNFKMITSVSLPDHPREKMLKKCMKAIEDSIYIDHRLQCPFYLLSRREKDTLKRILEEQNNAALSAALRVAEISQYFQIERIPDGESPRLIARDKAVKEIPNEIFEDLYDILSQYGPISMAYTFHECSSLTSIQFPASFKSIEIVSMNSMFSQCKKLKNLDMSALSTSSVTDMSSMFNECKEIKEIDLSNFDTSNVTDMSSMFRECNNISSLDVSSFDTSNVTNMNNMFSACSTLKHLDLSTFDTSGVVGMSGMFSECWKLRELDLSKFKTNKVKFMDEMFNECCKLKALDLSNFNTSSCLTMSSMFNECYNLGNLNLSSFNTSKVKSMDSMFNDCGKITNLDLSTFDTKNVTSMNFMFEYCSGLTTLDISSFHTKSNSLTFNRMFHKCSNLSTIKYTKNKQANIKRIMDAFPSKANLVTE